MINRRQFFQGGGALIVSFSLMPLLPVRAQATAGLPRFAQTNPQLDAWLSIAADGTVTLSPGRVELGQGVLTALGQIAAEELRVEMQRLQISPVDTAHSPNEGITAGSMSMEQGGSAVRTAAADAHQYLLQLAAQHLAVKADALAIRDGEFILDGRSTGLDYWQLLGGKKFNRTITGEGEIKPAASHRIVGTPVARIDIPAKAYAESIFIHDIRLPKMLHARLVRPPAPGARLLDLDLKAAKQIPALVKIVHDGSFLAVVAEREEQAVTGVEQLRPLCRWSEGQSLPDVNNMSSWLRAAAADVTVIAEQGKPDADGLDRISADYSRPYQAHASISPSIALAKYDAGKLTVWSHAQGMYPLREAIAGVTRLDRDHIRCIHAQGCGCYGHNGADDAACDAALIAMHVRGRPIRLQYSRADEFQWEPYGSAMSMRVEAALDRKGRIRDWQYHVWSCTHSTRPTGNRSAGNLLAAGLVAKPLAKPPAGSLRQPYGGGDRNAIPLYNFPNMRVSKHFIPEMPVRVSALRSLGAYANIFAIESFMDELALQADWDPIEFRIAHLKDQRAIDVLQRVRTISNWGYALKKNTGKGIGFAKYKNLSAYCAVVVHASVDRKTGEIRLQKAFAVADAGQAINPDGLRNQIEGGIIQSASWTLKERVNFSSEQIESTDWATYPVLRFSEVPELNVEVLDRPQLPPLGAGEASQGPAAAAIANAVADAVGVRLRDLPLKIRL